MGTYLLSFTSTGGGIPTSHPRLPFRRDTAVVIPAALAAIVVPILLLSLSQRIIFILLAAVAGLMLLVLVPIRWLPSVTLALFALLPLSVLPGNRFTASLSPTLVAVAVWAIRCGRSPRLREWPKATCSFLAVWLLVVTVTSIAHKASGLWTLNFILLVLAVVWLASKTTAEATRSLEQTWMVLGVCLGALATLEHVIGRNPITFLATHYTITEQYWSVYRVTTTLGTPLVNGTFFAAAFAIAWARLLSRPSMLSGLCFASAGGGLLFSYTRSALIGGAVALALVTIGRSFARGGLALKVIAVLAVAAAFVVGYVAIQGRTQSYEGVQSAQTRSRAIEAATVTASLDHYLGSGPGTSHRAQLAAGTQVAYYSPRLTIENSYLQLLVSIGVPGLAATLFLVLTRLGGSFRRRAYAGFGALAAVAVSAAGFNMAEDAVPTLVLLGLSMLLGMSSVDPPNESDQPGTEHELVRARVGMRIASD